MINIFTIRRALIETALDQPSCPFSSFFIYPSNFSPCLGFLAKNKSADAKRGFRDRRKQTLFSDYHSASRVEHETAA
jgi:type I restriction enzyme M protein